MCRVLSVRSDRSVAAVNAQREEGQMVFKKQGGDSPNSTGRLEMSHPIPRPFNVVSLCLRNECQTCEVRHTNDSSY